MITESKVFRSIAETIVPEAARLDDAAWRGAVAIMDHALAQRPRAMQRQLGVFVRALDVLSFLRHGRTLAHLSAPKRTKFLESVQDSRALLVRRGFWGLRTIILMGFYARPEAMSLIGYRAHVRGWQARQT